MGVVRQNLTRLEVPRSHKPKKRSRIGGQLAIKLLMTGWVCRGAPPITIDL